jgi:hypothetical protein
MPSASRRRGSFWCRPLRCDAEGIFLSFFRNLFYEVFIYSIYSLFNT